MRAFCPHGRVLPNIAGFCLTVRRSVSCGNFRRVRTEYDAELKQVRGMTNELQQLLDTREEKLRR